MEWEPVVESDHMGRCEECGGYTGSGPFLQLSCCCAAAARDCGMTLDEMRRQLAEYKRIRAKPPSRPQP